MQSVSIYLPLSTLTFTVGVGGVTAISVKAYWGNVSIVKIYYGSTVYNTYYAVTASIIETADTGIQPVQLMSASQTWAAWEILAAVSKVVVPAPVAGVVIFPQFYVRKWSDPTGTPFVNSTMRACYDVTPFWMGSTVSVLPIAGSSPFLLKQWAQDDYTAWNAEGTLEMEKDGLALNLIPIIDNTGGSGSITIECVYSLINK
jgi:hypothetical protein